MTDFSHILSHKNKYRYLPLKLFILLIIVTLCISLFGPRAYLYFNKEIVLWFMGAFLTVFVVGYFWGIHSRIHPAQNSIISARNEKYLYYLTTISIWISFVYFVISFIYNVAFSNMSVSFNLGENYYNYHQAKSILGTGVNTFRATPLEIVYLLIGFPRLLCMTLGLLFFKKLTFLTKNFLIVTLFLMFFISVFYLGHQKTLGDLFIYSCTLFFIYGITRYNTLSLKIVFICGLAVLLFFIACSIIQMQRIEARGIHGLAINNYMSDYTYYKPQHILFKILGERFGVGVASISTSYLAGGYYGLSLCLQLPFKFTWGLSLFTPLRKVVYLFTGYDGYDYHYITRMSEQFYVAGFSNWHTVFPYFAGDLTFPGVILLMGFVAYLWAICWQEVLIYKNPLSILLFCQLNLGLIFVPANNQILWGIDSNLAFWIVFGLWLFYHKSLNVAPRSSCPL